MGEDTWTAVKGALERLALLEAKRRTVMLRLRDLQCIRSDDVVGDLGEWLAKHYYGVPLEQPSNPGYDLQAGDKTVQVKTLRSDRYRRGSMGFLQPGFTHLFAIRLNRDYHPDRAFEVPRQVIEDLCPSGRMDLTKRMEGAPGVIEVSGEELVAKVRQSLDPEQLRAIGRKARQR